MRTAASVLRYAAAAWSSRGQAQSAALGGAGAALASLTMLSVERCSRHGMPRVERRGHGRQLQARDARGASESRNLEAGMADQLITGYTADHLVRRVPSVSSIV